MLLNPVVLFGSFAITKFNQLGYFCWLVNFGHLAIFGLFGPLLEFVLVRFLVPV